jgi:glutaredoxin
MKKLIFVVITIILIFGFYKLFSKLNSMVSGVSDLQADLILFWRDGCSHCEKVMKYITDNHLDSKIKIAYKDVYSDQNNQQLLVKTVKNCPEVDTSQGIGVPLAYSKKGNKCLYGDQPIIDWFAPLLK